MIANKLQRAHHLLGTVLEQFLHNTHNNPSRKRKPSHMMSKTQPRFYSTKKKRKIQDKAIDKPSQTEVAATQTTLDECEIDICGICFSEEDLHSTEEQIDWISCGVCDMWVHARCAKESWLKNSTEFTCPYCS